MFPGLNEISNPESAEQLIPSDERRTGAWKRVKGGKHIYATKWEAEEESQQGADFWQQHQDIGRGTKGFTHTGNIAGGRYGSLYVAFADGGRTNTGYAIYKYENVNSRWYYYLLNGPQPDKWFYYSFTKQNQARSKGRWANDEGSGWRSGRSRKEASEALAKEKQMACPYMYEYLGSTPFLRDYQGG